MSLSCKCINNFVFVNLILYLYYLAVSKKHMSNLIFITVLEYFKDLILNIVKTEKNYLF